MVVLHALSIALSDMLMKNSTIAIIIQKAGIKTSNYMLVYTE